MASTPDIQKSNHFDPAFEKTALYAAKELRLPAQDVNRVVVFLEACRKKALLGSPDGRSTVAAVIFHATQAGAAPVPPSMIAKTLLIGTMEMNRAIQKVKQVLGLSPKNVTPVAYLPKLVELLALPEDVLAVAREIARNTLPNAKSGQMYRHRPSLIAIALIYVACIKAKIRLPQKEIRVKTGTGERVMRDIAHAASNLLTIVK